MAREPEHKTPEPKTPEPKTEAPKTPDTTNTPVSINEPPGSGAVPEDQKPYDKRSKK